jgi:hypothetical protein
MWTCRLVAVGLGLFQAWAFRFEANPDGVSYLDVADAYREGRWSELPNGYWSPLYSWLLMAGAALVRPAPAYEFVFARAMSMVSLLIALVAFEFLLRGVVDISRRSDDSISDSPKDWWILGYALVVWSCLAFIGLDQLTPDLLVAAAAFASAGFLVRIRLGTFRSWHAVGLGTVLGLGYLAKASFLPLSVLLLGVAGILLGKSIRALRLLSLTLACVAIVVVPYVVALSQKSGELTIGDSGRLVYGWFVNDLPKWAHWQGGDPATLGIPTHSTRKISNTPEAYEFGSPLGGTYPPWYDPSYWYHGFRAQPDGLRQARIALSYIPLIVDLHAPLLVVVVAALIARRDRRTITQALSRAWWLIGPGIIAIAMYASLHIQGRYIGPFIIFVWLGALLAVEPSLGTTWRRGLFAALASVVLLQTLPQLAPSPRAVLPGRRNATWEEARFVLATGVRSGEAVALIGDGIYEYWARLARVRIVAEVPARAAGAFWSLDEEQRASILRSLKRAGVTALVSRGAPPTGTKGDWRVSEDRLMAVLRFP